jgi:hypothetical protein
MMKQFITLHGSHKSIKNRITGCSTIYDSANDAVSRLLFFSALVSFLSLRRSSGLLFLYQPLLQEDLSTFGYYRGTKRPGLLNHGVGSRRSDKTGSIVQRLGLSSKPGYKRHGYRYPVWDPAFDDCDAFLLRQRNTVTNEVVLAKFHHTTTSLAYLPNFHIAFNKLPPLRSLRRDGFEHMAGRASLGLKR